MEKKIKSIKTYVKIEDLDSEKHLHEVQEFDENGNHIHNVEYDESGEIAIEVKSVYNEMKKPQTEYTQNNLDGIGEKKSFTYNSEGRLSMEKIENDGGWISVRKYERLNDGKTIRISMFDEDDELEELTVIEFNDKGDILSTTNYDEDEKQIDVLKNTYDTEGKLLLREELDNKGRLEKAHHYYHTEENKISAVKTLNRKGKTLDWVKLAYNEDGKPIEQSTMSGAKIKIEYPEKMKTVETHINPGGEDVNKTTTNFDEDGNIIEEATTDKVTTYVYEYY